MSCSMSSVSDIKLIRTDTTLDLSQKGREAMAKMAHASQSAARLLHRRYGGAIADPTALPRMPACKCNNTTASLPF